MLKSSLVTGNINGRVKDTFEKVKLILEKYAPFDAWICMGNTASPLMTLEDKEYLQRIAEASPVQTKIFLLAHEYVGELHIKSEKIFFGGNFGCKRLGNIVIAWIAGIESRENNANNKATFTADDIKSFEARLEAAGIDSIDILLTFEWPLYAGLGAASCPVKTNFVGSILIASLHAKYPIRYHFAVSEDIFWEREPFEPCRVSSFSSCRFIGLGPALDSTQRWHYAMELDASNLERPLNCTSNPFITGNNLSMLSADYFFSVDIESKRPFSSIEEEALQASVQIASSKRKPPEDYKCNICGANEHFLRDCPHRELSGLAQKYICHNCHEPGHHIRSCPKRPDKVETFKQISSDVCWFCLSNPAIRKHLIIDIGNEIYMTLAKGGLTGQHVLLIPIEHVSSTQDLPDNAATELKLYLECLFERVRKEQALAIFSLHLHETHHWHTQVVPFDKRKVQDFIDFLKNPNKSMPLIFQEDLLSAGENSKFEEVESLTSIKDICLKFSIKYDLGDANFFCKKKGSFFPAQYGRQLLVEFLKMKNSQDWRSSNLSESEEMALVAKLKQEFKPFVPLIRPRENK